VYAPRATIAILAVAFATLGAAAAQARPADSIYQNKRLWATVNVCDTVGHPDSIGIRGSMPGSGDRKELMFMRFQVQYFTAADGSWHDVGEDADSGFVEVGSAKYRTRQSGITFTITPPPPGSPPHHLRGVVTFEWRQGGEVVRRARKRTTGNHPGTKGSDPRGFSAASCSIS
jgi:hypothetical protein